MRKVTMAVVLLATLALTFVPTLAGEIMFFEGGWAGKWVSSRNGDSAPMKALVQADASTGIITFVMFQELDSPAPSYSSISMGRMEGNKVVIDAASTSNIAGEGTEMTFWLENPVLLKGSYKNQYDEGWFEFRRSAGKDA